MQFLWESAVHHRATCGAGRVFSSCPRRFYRRTTNATLLRDSRAIVRARGLRPWSTLRLSRNVNKNKTVNQCDATWANHLLRRHTKESWIDFIFSIENFIGESQVLFRFTKKRDPWNNFCDFFSHIYCPRGKTEKIGHQHCLFWAICYNAPKFGWNRFTNYWKRSLNKKY